MLRRQGFHSILAYHRQTNTHTDFVDLHSAIGRWRRRESMATNANLTRSQALQLAWFPCQCNKGIKQSNNSPALVARSLGWCKDTEGCNLHQQHVGNGFILYHWLWKSTFNWFHWLRFLVFYGLVRICYKYIDFFLILKIDFYRF